jgi:hypothetical protein
MFFLEVGLSLNQKIRGFHRHLEFPELVQANKYRGKIWVLEDLYERYAAWAQEFGLEAGHFMGVVLVNMLGWYDQFVPKGHLITKEEMADLLAARLASASRQPV